MTIEEKECIRKTIKQKLNALSIESRNQKNILIHKKLFDNERFKRSKCVCIYVSFSNEVDTHEIIRLCITKGKTILVPRVDGASGTLEIRKISSWKDDLEYGSYGILEPKESQTNKIDINEADCIVVPGIAFTTQGHRLGRGKGYYDKLLSHAKDNVYRIALAYDFQMVEVLPQNDHDKPVNLVLTA